MDKVSPKKGECRRPGFPREQTGFHREQFLEYMEHSSQQPASPQPHRIRSSNPRHLGLSGITTAVALNLSMARCGLHLIFAMLKDGRRVALEWAFGMLMFLPTIRQSLAIRYLVCFRRLV